MDCSNEISALSTLCEWSRLLTTTRTTLLRRTILLHRRQRPCIRPKVLGPWGSVLILKLTRRLLAGCLICWLCSYVFAISSTTIRLETFLISRKWPRACGIALSSPVLSFRIRFQESSRNYEELNRTYGSAPWLRTTIYSTDLFEFNLSLIIKLRVN